MRRGEVGQIARIKGARAVGIAGGAEKVQWLKEIGFDAAVDHRSPTFAEDLAAAVPDGIDGYFENVGGAVWDAVLPLLNDFARVPVCGLIANYNLAGPPAGPDRSPMMMDAVLEKSLTFADGRIRYRDDVIPGLENAADAFIGLLSGKNFGKLLAQIGDAPAG